MIDMVQIQKPAIHTRNFIFKDRSNPGLDFQNLLDLYVQKIFFFQISLIKQYDPFLYHDLTKSSMCLLYITFSCNFILHLAKTRCSNLIFYDEPTCTNTGTVTLNFEIVCTNTNNKYFQESSLVLLIINKNDLLYNLYLYFYTVENINKMSEPGLSRSLVVHYENRLWYRKFRF